jgi:predicted GH43/DUF377 family glycosyl hydrolase
MRRACAAALFLLAGCRRYADFRLPPLAPGDERRSFTWEARADPVLARGSAGEWDSSDALNPSVIRTENSLFNFYSGYHDGTWRTGLASSADGITWRKLGMVLEPNSSTWEGNYIAANGSAWPGGGEYLYWYQAGPKETPRIGLARSPDGLKWRKISRPVLDVGPRSSWDERGVADPYVVRFGGIFYLYYLGQDRAHRQRLGVARSADGLLWEKLRANPILELGEAGAFDERGLGEPAVWQSHGFYWMLYTGRDTAERRRLGLARSSDGINWRKLPAVFAGQRPWDDKVICDPTIEVAGDTVRVWFGGGDLASPDENLHGQIGYGVLHGTLAK